MMLILKIVLNTTKSWSPVYSRMKVPVTVDEVSAIWLLFSNTRMNISEIDLHGSLRPMPQTNTIVRCESLNFKGALEDTFFILSQVLWAGGGVACRSCKAVCLGYTAPVALLLPTVAPSISINMYCLQPARCRAASS